METKSSGVIYSCTPTGCSVHGHNPGILGAPMLFPAHTTTTTVFWTLLNVIGLFLKKYVHQHLSQTTLTIANRSFNSVRLLSTVHTIGLWACTKRDPQLFQVVSAIDLYQANFWKTSCKSLESVWEGKWIFQQTKITQSWKWEWYV